MSSSDFTLPEIPAKGIMESLSDDDRRLLSSYGEFLPVQAGQLFISEGNTQDSLYFVISGNLHASTSQGGRPVLLGKISAGETFGEMNIFHPAQASANVSAVEFSQVWKITRQNLEDFVNASPLAAAQLMFGIANTMSRRLRDMNEKLSTVTYL